MTLTKSIGTAASWWPATNVAKAAVSLVRNPYSVARVRISGSLVRKSPRRMPFGVRPTKVCLEKIVGSGYISTMSEVMLPSAAAARWMNWLS